MESNAFGSRRLRFELSQLSEIKFWCQGMSSVLHTFVSIFGDKEAILTVAV